MLEEKSEWKRRERRGEEESFPLGFVCFDLLSFMKDAKYLPKSSGIMRRRRIRLENQNLLVEKNKSEHHLDSALRRKTRSFNVCVCVCILHKKHNEINIKIK